MFSHALKVTRVVVVIAACLIAQSALTPSSAEPMAPVSPAGAIGQPMAALMDGGK